MNSALATAEYWHLKGLTLKVKMQVLKQHLLETITAEMTNIKQAFRLGWHIQVSNSF